MALAACLWRWYLGLGSVFRPHVFRAVARLTANFDLTVTALLPIAHDVRCCLRVALDALRGDVLSSLPVYVRGRESGQHCQESDRGCCMQTHTFTRTTWDGNVGKEYKSSRLRGQYWRATF